MTYRYRVLLAFLVTLLSGLAMGILLGHTAPASIRGLAALWLLATGSWGLVLLARDLWRALHD